MFRDHLFITFAKFSEKVTFLCKIFEKLTFLTPSYAQVRKRTNPAGNYMFKVNTRTRCEICSKLTCSRVSIVNFKQVNTGWEMNDSLGEISSRSVSGTMSGIYGDVFGENVVTKKLHYSCLT